MSGTYVLLLALGRAAVLSVGRLGRMRFPAGYYAYAGSAFGPGGLGARVGRHLKRDKKLRWHIDHLRRRAPVREVWFTCSPERLEHRFAAVLAAMPGSNVPAPGFGASDCGCATHLYGFKERPPFTDFTAMLRENGCTAGVVQCSGAAARSLSRAAFYRSLAESGA